MDEVEVDWRTMMRKRKVIDKVANKIEATTILATGKQSPRTLYQC